MDEHNKRIVCGIVSLIDSSSSTGFLSELPPVGLEDKPHDIRPVRESLYDSIKEWSSERFSSHFRMSRGLFVVSYTMLCHCVVSFFHQLHYYLFLKTKYKRRKFVIDLNVFVDNL